ncbi:hypothetical protein KIPB_004748 [Kipferlia bialata]|uniref:HORMA domain-containing protein n=1 Tax=Kipferlia bialata TaxID=797122 RepID=A0A9K3GIF6_9EUKA|nr:hypothetical protein KIPB_004748 [Kipferlia bialata]|eukprot:g4748.t1
MGFADSLPSALAASALKVFRKKPLKLGCSQSVLYAFRDDIDSGALDLGGCILYLRGVYQPDAFERVPKYGVPMQIAKDPGLMKYLGTVLQNVSE